MTVTGKSLLLVEDDRDSGAELVELLELFGFAAVHVPGIDEAVAACGSELPDFAVIDASIGGNAGCRLGRDLLDRSGGAMRVVIVSGRELGSDERAVLPSAAAPFLLKPIDLDALLAALDRCGSGDLPA